MNFFVLGLFVVSAVALLGSPGPGIASLIAVGRAKGFAGGLRYFGGLQVGLAIAAAVSAAGLFSLVGMVPGATAAMRIAAMLYLLWLAWQIASAPVGERKGESGIASSFAAGMFLGLSNPKSFVAFISLFASQTIIAGNRQLDTLLKWLLVVAVMIVVDLLWLLAGAGLQRARLSPKGERAFNILFGLLIVGATVLSL